MKKSSNNFYLIKRGLREIHDIRKGLLGLIISHAICISLFPFINIYMSALIINKIADGKNLIQLLWYVGITITLNLAVTLVNSILKHFISLFRFEFDSNLAMKMSHKMIKMNYADLENPNTHYKRTKIDEYKNMNNGGIGCLMNVFSTVISSLFSIIFSITLTITLFTTLGTEEYTGILSVVISPLFSIILVLVIILYAVIGIFINEKITKKKYSTMNDIIPFNRIFSYYLDSYINTYHAGKDIRIFRQQDLIEEETQTLFSDAYITLDKLSKNQVKYSSIILVSEMILNVFIYLFIGLKALAGIFGVGFILQYIESIRVFTKSFSRLLMQFSILNGNNEALKTYFDYMDMPSENHSEDVSLNKKLVINKYNRNYEIEFCNVSFKYPESNTYALKNISFKIKCGDKIAIVGENGSGKTTFVKLLCRLYNPTKGIIKLNGIDIKEYSYEEYLNIFSVVFQDFKLFSFELGQNISTSIDYDEHRVKKCLQKVGLEGNIYNNLDICLYKDFDDNGLEVSGGEAQKIALARAIYRESPFIILDEPTAALDPISEYEIYSNFDKILEDKTAIYISHRLSSCHFSDTIIVFNDGKIVQSGKHKELVQDKSGKYYNLWQAQAQYYTNG